MEMLHLVLWMIYPYTIMAIVIMGIIWQYDISNMSFDSETNVKTSKLMRKTISSLVILSITTGIAVIFSSDPVYLVNWMTSLLLFNPDTRALMNISILSQIHLLLVLTLLLFLSLSNYFSYLFTPRRLLKFHIDKKFNKL
jgi:nitrate reductase gamma subunit